MTNWRELPAGRELDKLIALKMGWRVEKIAKTEMKAGEVTFDGETFQAPNINVVQYILYYPDGLRARETWESEDRAWKYVPEYSKFADVALMLPLEDDEWLEINIFRGVAYARIGVNGEDGSDQSLFDPQVEGSEEVSLAVCQAWLANKERRKRKEAGLLPPPSAQSPS